MERSTFKVLRVDWKVYPLEGDAVDVRRHYVETYAAEPWGCDYRDSSGMLVGWMARGDDDAFFVRNEEGRVIAHAFGMVLNQTLLKVEECGAWESWVPGDYYIMSIAVDQGYRCSTIAKSLLEAMIGSARERGCARIVGKTIEGHFRVSRALRKWGFVIEDEKPVTADGGDSTTSFTWVGYRKELG